MAKGLDLDLYLTPDLHLSAFPPTSLLPSLSQSWRGRRSIASDGCLPSLTSDLCCLLPPLPDSNSWSDSGRLGHSPSSETQVLSFCSLPLAPLFPSLLGLVLLWVYEGCLLSLSSDGWTEDSMSSHGLFPLGFGLLGQVRRRKPQPFLRETYQFWMIQRVLQFRFIIAHLVRFNLGVHSCSIWPSACVNKVS